jgi:hypothetical protein
MASTNEDVVVLATARHDNGRLLVVRHLPDRGTIELGWWVPDENGTVTPEPSVLELAAETVEVGAVAQLCTRLAGVRWGTAAEDQTVAATPARHRRRPGRGRVRRGRPAAGPAARGR